MDIGKIINQAINILLHPHESLKKYKDEKITRNDIIIYLGIVGFPTFIGILIGFGYTGFWAQGFVRAIVFYILAVIGTIVFGYIFNELAPHFKSQKNLNQAVKLVVYSSTPWLVAGILWIIPYQFAGLISFLAALYGLYILYIGLPIYMNTPKDQQIIYLIIGLILMGIVMGVTAAIANSIWWAMFSYPYGYLG